MSPTNGGEPRRKQFGHLSFNPTHIRVPNLLVTFLLFVFDSVAQSDLVSVYGTSANDANLDALDATDLIRTLNGGYILVGGGAGVIKTDANGDIDWSKRWTIDGFTSAVCAKSMHQTSDSGFIIAGRAYQDMFILRTDAQGAGA